MIKKSHIGNYLKPVMMAGLLFVCSCSDDDEIASNTDRLTTSDVVTFNIQTTNRWTPDVIGDGQDEAEAGSRTATRSRSVALPMESVEGNAPATDIYMYMIEEDYLPEADTTTVASRSSETTETTGATGDFEGVGVIAYHTVGESTSIFMENINLDSYTGDRYWPGTGTLDFYAYYPHVKMDEESNGLTLSMVDNIPTFTYVVPTEIDKQRDLMDGASRKVPGDKLSSVDMQLNHVMSQIQVKIPDKGIVDGEITSITFKGIYNEGTRKMATPYPTSSSMTVDANMCWELDKDAEPVDYVLLRLDFEKAMYLMPQQLREDAEIEIKMSVTSANPEYKANTEGKDPTRQYDYTLKVNLKGLAPTWKPNKKYTYVVSTPEEVKVEVTDEVNYEGDYPVKENVVIKNTGLSAAWIRVSVLGAWMVDKQDTEGNTKQLVVDEWKNNGNDEDDGLFVWPSCGKPSELTTNAHHWRKCSDGYFYYMKEVPRGETLKELFTSYKLTADAPMADAYLELTILAQAILPADRDHIWPEEILNDLQGNQ